MSHQKKIPTGFLHHCHASDIQGTIGTSTTHSDQICGCFVLCEWYHVDLEKQSNLIVKPYF